MVLSAPAGTYNADSSLFVIMYYMVLVLILLL